jgi:hypothetical protein
MPTFQELFISGAFSSGKWISEVDAMKQVRERYSCPAGYAFAVVREIVETGSVRPLRIDETDRKGRDEYGRKFVIKVAPHVRCWSREDFLYILDRQQPPTPQRRRKKIPSKSATSPRLNEVALAFRGSGIDPTMKTFVDFGRAQGISDQAALREKYRNVYGNPGRGRPLKNRRK